MSQNHLLSIFSPLTWNTIFIKFLNICAYFWFFYPVHTIMFFHWSFDVTPKDLFVLVILFWIFLATNACLLFTQTLEGIYPVWKQKFMLIFIGFILTPRLMIDGSWHFVLGSWMSPQDDSLWLMVLLDFVTLEEDLTLGAKDSLCYSELWVDFIKPTGIEGSFQQ